MTCCLVVSGGGQSWRHPFPLQPRLLPYHRQVTTQLCAVSAPDRTQSVTARWLTVDHVRPLPHRLRQDLDSPTSYLLQLSPGSSVCRQVRAHLAHVARLHLEVFVFVPVSDTRHLSQVCSFTPRSACSAHSCHSATIVALCSAKMSQSESIMGSKNLLRANQLTVTSSERHGGSCFLLMSPPSALTLTAQRSERLC